MFKSCFNASPRASQSPISKPPLTKRQSNNSVVRNLSATVKHVALSNTPQAVEKTRAPTQSTSFRVYTTRHKQTSQRRRSAVELRPPKSAGIPRRVKSVTTANESNARQTNPGQIAYRLPRRNYNSPPVGQLMKSASAIPKPSRLIDDLKNNGASAIKTLRMPIGVHNQPSWKRQQNTNPTKQPSATSLASHSTRSPTRRSSQISRRDSSSTLGPRRSSNLRVVSRQSSRPKKIDREVPKVPVEVVCEQIFSKVDRTKDHGEGGNHVYMPYNPSFGLSAVQHKDIQGVIKRSQQRQTTRRQGNTPVGSPRELQKNASCQQLGNGKSQRVVKPSKVVPPSAPADLHGARPRGVPKSSDSTNTLRLSSKRFAKLERAVQNKLIERLSRRQLGSRRQQSTGSIDRTTTGTSAASPTSGLLGGGAQQGDYLDAVLKCVADKQYAGGQALGEGLGSKAKTKSKWLGRAKTPGKLSKGNSSTSIYLSQNAPHHTTKNAMLFVSDIYAPKQTPQNPIRSPPQHTDPKKPNPNFSAYTQKLMQLTPRDSSEHSTPRYLQKHTTTYRTHRATYEDDLDFALDPGGGKKPPQEATFLDDDDVDEQDFKAQTHSKLADCSKSTQNLRDSGAGSGGSPGPSSKRNNGEEETRSSLAEKEKLQSNNNLSKYVKQLKRRLSNAAAKGSVMALSRNATNHERDADVGTSVYPRINTTKTLTSLAMANASGNAQPLHRSSTIVRPPSGRPKVNRTYSTNTAITTKPCIKSPNTPRSSNQHAIIRRHQLNLHDQIDKIAPKPPSENPSYASNSQTSSSESQTGSVEHVDDDVSSASEDEGVDVIQQPNKPQNCSSASQKRSTPKNAQPSQYASNTAICQETPLTIPATAGSASLRHKSSFKSTLTSKMLGKKPTNLHKSQTFVVDGSKYRARYASTNDCAANDAAKFYKDAASRREKSVHVVRQSSFNHFSYRHSSTNKKLSTGVAAAPTALHNKLSLSTNELSPGNAARGRSPAVAYGHKVGGSNSALARRFQKNSPKPALTAAQISEKIKKEIDMNSRTAAQLNLLMNKTMKWVMTQEFDRHREADEYAYS